MTDTSLAPTPDASAPTPVLTVCVTCRRGLSTAELGDGPAPGHQFFNALADEADELGIMLQSVECMSLCGQGGTATISTTGKRTLLLGNLGMEKIDDFKEWLKLYSASKTGMVPASRRAPSLSDMIIARLPPDLTADRK